MFLQTDLSIQNKMLLKNAYGLSNLKFFYKGKSFCCKYCSSPKNAIDTMSFEDMDFILRALHAQQGKITFIDTNTVCNGIDELRKQYLIFLLGGIK